MKFLHGVRPKLKQLKLALVEVRPLFRGFTFTLREIAFEAVKKSFAAGPSETLAGELGLDLVRNEGDPAATSRRSSAVLDGSA